MMGYGYGMMGWFVMMIIPLILVGLIIYAIVRLSQARQGNYEGQGKRNTALDTLNERFAKGEISEEEYNKKKKMISES